MTAAPELGIPPLAGQCTYADAARAGLSVEENVRRLLRYHWIERRLFEAAVAHLPGTPEWEVKCALALHQYQDIEHAAALRRRVAEMRSPAPRMDVAPDRALDALLEEALRAANTVELLAGYYGVLRPALAAAYRRHLEDTNPLVDHPTCRVLRLALLEQEDAIAWGARALDALTSRAATSGAGAAAWQQHLRAYLAAAGGIAGDAPAPAVALPAPRAVAAFAPRTTPRRDDRFAESHNFNFPPHVVYADPAIPPEERNLAQLCRRTLEMDVPEMMASFMAERAHESIEFCQDYGRQLWDEARHAMMGSVWFEARGIDWTRIPLNVGFALRLSRHATPLERQAVLYSIEQGLMPGETGKRMEWETARAAGDALSTLFHDYDWADEVLHAQIGRRRMQADGLSVRDALALAEEVQARTWSALDGYRSTAPQREWWRSFVRTVLGRESAAADDVVHAQPLTS
jgi:hypothetical protein